MVEYEGFTHYANAAGVCVSCEETTHYVSEIYAAWLHPGGCAREFERNLIDGAQARRRPARRSAVVPLKPAEAPPATDDYWEAYLGR